MYQSISLLRRMTRNVRWYFADVLTGITGKGTLHFTYEPHNLDRDGGLTPRVNPATGLPMISKTVDAGGNPYGTSLRH